MGSDTDKFNMLLNGKHNKSQAVYCNLAFSISIFLQMASARYNGLSCQP